MLPTFSNALAHPRLVVLVEVVDVDVVDFVLVVLAVLLELVDLLVLVVTVKVVFDEELVDLVELVDVLSVVVDVVVDCSNTTTSKIPIAKFPPASVALQVTLVVPTGNIDPFTGKHDTTKAEASDACTT